jgi:hypothetical protein
MQRRNWIQVLYHLADDYCARIVFAALQRSFSASQVRLLRYEDSQADAAVTVLIQPGEIEQSAWRQFNRPGNKTVVFGLLGKGLAAELGLCCESLPAAATGWDETGLLDNSRPFDASPLTIRYAAGVGLAERLSLRMRFLCRYDFADEWNNHGYGRVAASGGPWSLCQRADAVGARRLAEVVDAAGAVQTVYASLTDLAGAAVLWFNRPVGPVDSAEWTVVEEFVSSYRPEDLVCLPCLNELPPGVGAVVSPRLDCDQAVDSAGALLNLYGDYQIPLSFAILTGLPLIPADTALLQQAVRQGGSLHSHSQSHLPDWGGSYAAALVELKDSAAWLERQFPGRRFGCTAVSPFHQNPVFAVEAMRDAGYTGFVGGIIHNDPEFLLGRAGQVPFVESPLVSLSQQCMLHGDCFHRYGNSVEPYLESFRCCRQAGAFFGYLDHPFSAAYQYGWDNETERLSAHEGLIRAIRNESGVVWWSLQQCLDYLMLRNRVGVEWIDANRWRQTGDAPLQSVDWRWRGSKVAGGSD